MNNIKNEITVNENDNLGLTPDDIKLKQEEEATVLIDNVGKQVYNIPRHDEELNLYGSILNSLQDENDKNNFILLFKNVEPNLINKNDIVQKVIISSVLYNKLFLLKQLKNDFDVFRVTTGINYRKDNGTWLNEMLTYTIPFLVNNELLKELNNV